MKRPNPGDFKSFYLKYIDLVTSNDPVREMRQSLFCLQSILSKITEEQANTSYEAGKWTVKELLSHLMDVERVMAYRALCIARGETADLPIFDDELYVKNSGVAERSLQSLLEEHYAMRMANIRMFEGFSAEMLDRTGSAGNHPVTVTALAYILVGHELHHTKVLQERYLGN